MSHNVLKYYCNLCYVVLMVLCFAFTSLASDCCDRAYDQFMEESAYGAEGFNCTDSGSNGCTYGWSMNSEQRRSMEMDKLRDSITLLQKRVEALEKATK